MTSDRKRQLRQALDNLAAEVANLGPADEQLRDELRTALARIAQQLETSESAGTRNEEEDATSDETAISARLLATARRFEASHPTLAGMLESLVDAMAQMGI